MWRSYKYFFNKISSAVANIMEYKEHRVNNNLATVNCRKRKQARLQEDKAALEVERAKRLEAEGRARKFEKRVRELEAQVQQLMLNNHELEKENRCLRGVDNDEELQSLQDDFNDVCGTQTTAKLLTTEWNSLCE